MSKWGVPPVAVGGGSWGGFGGSVEWRRVGRCEESAAGVLEYLGDVREGFAGA